MNTACNLERELERDVERYLCWIVRRAGGMALKFESPGKAGVPDRIVLFRDRPPVFVEVKRPGGRLRPLQVKVCRDISSYGVDVYVVTTREEADDFVNGRLLQSFHEGLQLRKV